MQLSSYERQTWLEEQYSRKYVLGQLMNHLESDTDLMGTINKCGNTYERWLDLPFQWDRKVDRLNSWKQHLIDNEITGTDVVMKVLMTIISEGLCTIQTIAGTSGIGNSDDKFDNVATTGELLCLTQASGLFKVIHPRDADGYRYIENNIELPERLVQLFQNIAYMPPVLHDVYVDSNSDAGWITKKESIFLNGHHHEGKAPLDFLNVINNVEMAIDRNMLQYNEVGKNTRVTTDPTIRVARDMLRQGNRFKFIYRFDARYRSYASGYQLSPQGNDFRKALLNLAKEELLTDEIHF